MGRLVARFVHGYHPSPRGENYRSVGQTDYEGWYNLGFPTGDYSPGCGLGYFPVLEPGTYEVLIGGMRPISSTTEPQTGLQRGLQ